MEILIATGCFLIGFVLAKIQFDRSKGIPKEQYDSVLKEKSELNTKHIELIRDVSRLETENKNLQEKLEKEKAEIDNFQSKFEAHFKNLANGILETQSSKFQTMGEKSIKDIVDPLKVSLRELQENVIETKSLNQDMTKEAKSLALALRGDSLTQGKWGEMLLSQILDRSGLREGEGYIVQGKGLGLKTLEGEGQKPDVIINIPDPEKTKHIIIDSKVSLTAYDAYINTADPQAKEAFLKDFLVSVKKHVGDLSGKKYEYNEKLNSPDFVLMFMPIEGAFALALQSDINLFPDAWDKNIVIVSPTTLLVTLRTVAALWGQERISRNVMKIAEQAGSLYDKFVNFLSDLETIGTKLKDAQTSYDEALKKIQTGKGNLIDKIESIKTLGAKASKQISSKFLQEAKDDKD